MNNQTSKKTLWMALTAILSAIIIVMTLIPGIGYLQIGVISISFLMIPVVIGAIQVGPACGAFLGGVFGITSFIQCFRGDLFGFALVSINPFLTFILCMVPRILMGLFVGLIFRALSRFDAKKTWSLAIASLSGAVINTVLFLGTLFLFFRDAEYIQKNILPILFGAIVVNAIAEAVVCTIIGTAITKALSKAMPKTSTT